MILFKLMQSIKELLNKIKWDKSLDPKDFTIIYDDKGVKKEVAYSDIKQIEGRFMLLDGVEIPVYRVVEIREKGKTIFKR